MPLWSGTRRLAIFSARFSRFVGEYRCPAIHAAWHRSKINGGSSSFGVRPGQWALKIGMSSGGFDRSGAAETSEASSHRYRSLSLPPVHTALLAARHVALGEDLIAPQEASLATSGDAAGRDLAFLDGTPSGSGFRVSDQPSAGRQRNQCRRCQKNDCQRED